MQDLRSVGGGGGRIFGVDRRFRSNINQPLKCPRCESSNTKFCYYNNYNLSQPRHFCKNCRRYWTKGGILRNVPVGGGCRKTKRSKSKPSPEVQKEKNSTSHSSSESSNFTATATATVTETALVCTSTPEATFLNFLNPSFNFVPSVMETLDQSSAAAGGILPETGNYTSLLTASNPGFLGFDFSEFSPLKLHHQSQSHQQQNQQEKVSTSMIEELKLQELTSTSYLDQTVPANSRNGGLTALEWQNSGGQGLFDLPSSVDQDYWNQSQWNDTDDPLYH